MSTLSNFARLLVSNSVCAGQVGNGFAGAASQATCYAGLNVSVPGNSLSTIITRAEVHRDEFNQSDDVYDRNIYSLLVMSPWFPFATGINPQEALNNLVVKINQPWMSETAHLLPFLVERVINRWQAKTLIDPDCNQYMFHIDMKYVVPESEKYK